MTQEQIEEVMADPRRPRLTLTGTDGNVFSILGKAQRALRQAGYSPDELKEFVAEATSGDYDHALQTAMQYCDVD